jgi:hypothetical protein
MKPSRAATLWLAAAAAGLPHIPVAASLPDPPESHDYYGPVRACGEGYAFDAREGEAFSDVGATHALFFPGGMLFLESWIYGGVDMSKAAEPLGSVALPGGAHLTRLRVTWPDRAPEIVYHYDRKTGPLPIVAIHSNRFDGSARDLALLGRIAFGPAAKGLCASIPERLRLSPQRDDPDAEIFDPRRRPGPLTICFAGLAFDVRASEAALLPWFPLLKHFRLVGRNGRATDVDVRLWSPLPRLRPGVPLGRSREVELMDGYIPTSRRLPGLEEERKAHLRLVQKGPAGFATGSDPQAQFAFDPAIGEAERRAILSRLRGQRPADRCTGEVKPAKIGAATHKASR